jgi:replicative DNA helicase
MPDIYQFSDEFQLKILSLAARDKATFISYRDVIKPMYFKKAIHIDIARIVHEFYDREIDRAKMKQTPINAPTMEVLWEEIRMLTSNNKVKEKLRTDYEDTVIDMYQANLSDAEYVKDNLIKFGRRAALERAILQSVEDIEKGTDDFSKIEERITKAIRVGEDISDLGTSYFKTAKERMETYAKGTDGVRRIPTGMTGLDRAMGGGLGAGELGVIIAPPNRGKSFALINIGAGAVVEGLNVVHYTLEMPEKQVTKRYDQRLMKKNFDYLKDNGSKVLAALQNMQKVNKGELIVKRFSARSCNINTIRAHLTKLAIELDFHPDLIIVDYGDLVQPTRTYADKRFELESVYLDLRDLGVEYDCPVWTASQSNRDSMSKKVITISELAEAFNKANIADFMCALCQTDEEKDTGEMRWHIAKQRDGVANVTLDGEVDYATAQMMVYELAT